MKSILPSLMCLLIGLGAGYGLRPAVSGDAAAENVNGKDSAASKGTSAGSRPGSQAAAGVSTPITDVLKSLIGDYDLHSARKAFASLSAAEI
jgi:hypothetical protein